MGYSSNQVGRNSMFGVSPPSSPESAKVESAESRWGPFTDTPPSSPSLEPSPILNTFKCPKCKGNIYPRKTSSANLKNPSRDYWACDKGHSTFFLWCDEAVPCHSCKTPNKALTSTTAKNPGRKFTKCSVCEKFEWV